MSLSFPTLSRHGEEPPPEVAAALLEADAAALITGFSLSHTAARVEATQRGLRVASMPAITRGDVRDGRSPSTTGGWRRWGGTSPPS